MSDEVRRPGNPWDRRGDSGPAGAFLAAVKKFVLSPSEAFGETRETGDYAGPLIFAILLGWISVAIGQLWSLLFGASLLPVLPEELTEQLGPLLVSSWFGFVVQLLLAPVYVVVGVFIGSAILHLCLMLIGGLESSRSGFEGTYRVVCFASVANLGQIVPLAGGLVSAVWWIALGTIGLSRMHLTTTGRALAAVLIPLLLCCVCIAVGAVIFGATIAALLSGSG